MIENPIQKFTEWFTLAKNTPAIADATAMTLATATRAGSPSARIVLLKGFDNDGFVFYTNTASRKGDELAPNPHAALCFYWAPLDRQVRIEGAVTPVTAREADEYFASRPHESQVGAWTSEQSRPLPARETLEKRFADYSEKYSGLVPRPAHWSGYRLAPEAMEFWEARPHRLHHRELFTRGKDGWKMELLYP